MDRKKDLHVPLIAGCSARAVLMRLLVQTELWRST